MSDMKPMAIYRCRRCGKKFEAKGIIDYGTEAPTGAVWKSHQCYNDGIYGWGDLIGSYMKENK